MRGLIGKKVGMTRVFSDNGEMVPVTVIEAGPCYVTQIKTPKTDMYSAVQLGFQVKKNKHTTKPLAGHFKKAGTEPQRILREFRDFESGDDLKLGDEIKADIFTEGEKVSVSGRTKGRGFAGVIKRHNFGGGPKTHGQSDRFRAPGSIGQSSWPSRVFKGMKMAGRYGGVVQTVKNIEIVKIDASKNLIMVKGAVPGAVNSIVIIGNKN